MDIGNLAAAISHKYGSCADTAVNKDGSFSITRWDSSIAGIDEPTQEELRALVRAYEIENPADKYRKRLGKLLTQVEDPAVQKLLKHILKEEAADA